MSTDGVSASSADANGTDPIQAGGRRNESEDAVLGRIEAFRKRPARLLEDHITLSHGAGGKASAALIEAVFIEAFGAPSPGDLADAAILAVPDGRLAFSTDSYVVNPIQFPGGSIGDLAVNGTVNDLAVSGARPLWLSAAFVIEEGLAISQLRTIANQMRTAADVAGVRIVTGDTKVVPRGAADKVFVTTSGIGLIPDGRVLSAASVKAGDRMVLSGALGGHGMAVMMARGDLAIEADIRSDTKSIASLVEALYTAEIKPRWMRDATRGGLATVANELTSACGLGLLLDDDAVPVDPTVRACCDMLGIDPLYVANEGCFAAIVPAEQTDIAVTALRQAGAEQAAVVGQIVADPPGIVAVRNAYGGVHILDMLVGDPLPRIC